MSNSNLKPYQILKKYFTRKKKAYVQFSLRSLARQLSLPPSYVSEILNGKKPTPQLRFQAFVKALDMDDFAASELENAIIKYQLKLPNTSRVNTKKQNYEKISETYEPMPVSDSALLNHWYYLAIADLCTCADFLNDPEWIGKKLGISPILAERALDFLISKKIIENKDGKFIKNNLQLRFPYKGSHPSVLKFHREMHIKALDDIKQVNESNYNLRIFNGITVAIDKSKIEEIRSILKEAIYNSALLASSGDCNDLYYINLGVFPLTKS